MSTTSNQANSSSFDVLAAEAEIKRLLLAYRRLNETEDDEQIVVEPDGELLEKQRFLEKFLEFQTQLAELKQALKHLKAKNQAKQTDLGIDLEQLQKYVHTMTQDFITDCKQIGS